MDHIETAILNCYGIREAEQNMVFAARLTQHGHTIQNMADLMDLYRQSYSQKTVENIAGLPHTTVQKFMVITVAVVGASRRFLAQITRHQNEVKYMSASLQYSNYSGHAAFAIPYGIMKADKEIQDIYKKSCQSDLDHYAELCALGIDHDSAGYLLLSCSASSGSKIFGFTAGIPSQSSSTLKYFSFWKLLICPARSTNMASVGV